MSASKNSGYGRRNDKSYGAFGNALQIYIEKGNSTQSSLAEKSGIPKETLNRMMKGDRLTGDVRQRLLKITMTLQQAGLILTVEQANDLFKTLPKPYNNALDKSKENEAKLLQILQEPQLGPELESGPELDSIQKGAKWVKLKDFILFSLAGRIFPKTSKYRLILVITITIIAILIVGMFIYLNQPEPTPEVPDNMAYIKEGDFIQGSTNDEINYFGSLCIPDKNINNGCNSNNFTDELDRRTVYLSTYSIVKYEVTNKEFRKFVESKPYTTTAETEGEATVFKGTSISKVPMTNWQHPEGPNSDIKDKDDFPVVQVSYKDASEYCKSVLKKLPTDAQWEKAARGPNGNLFPWGNMWGELFGNYVRLDANNMPYASQIAKVGSYPKDVSPYGVYDMMGNVSEWVADIYDQDFYKNSKPRNPFNNPSTVSADAKHSRRGGNWGTQPGFLHAAWRIVASTAEPSNTLGFRCVEDPFR